MDAFTIAPALPIEDEPVEAVLVDSEKKGTSSSHSGCVIA